jgi:hypothetical protein
MFSIVKPFLISVTIITFLLFAIGSIQFKKSDYACFNGKKIHFGNKVKLVDVGSMQLYGFPLISDCPKDERYDPKTIYECGYQTFCQKDPNEATAEQN